MSKRTIPLSPLSTEQSPLLQIDSTKEINGLISYLLPSFETSFESDRHFYSSTECFADKQTHELLSIFINMQPLLK
ncbi:hypothetical protein H6G00_34365 [Leptolyngbya sp. FACHB-541]|uniref:hypothetical protein n=1 Tax=Leptolyngbya sp. FACHB-541 TaxID=2692810 RepID=UPI001688C91E|nr:hypothetical protein [Leptolyngbya sp. FACHB-541]MBD2001615.1 hypothetical protein [Leptolyngbya sp. FACHB-541]